ncbi:hypothetical protein [Sphingomonas sp. UYP23]
MTCDVVAMPNDLRAIVCSSRKRERCACGRAATLLCDWKVPAKKRGTCDAPLCSRCTYPAAAEKDLCPTHREAFDRWRAARAAARGETRP